MKTGFIEKHKKIFRCPDTEQELILIRTGEENQHFVNQFETKYPISKGFVSFIASNTDKIVIKKHSPEKDTLSEVYENLVGSGDFFSSLLSNFMFGKKLDLQPFRNAMTVFLTELQRGMVLDMPVMTGQISPEIYGNFPRMEFVALDLPTDVLCLCYDRMKVKSPDNLMLVQAVPAKLPFKSETFDAVTSFAGINFMKDYKTALKEIFRVLKEKGSFSGVAFLSDSNSITSQLFDKFISSKPAIETISTTDELQEAFTEAGFRNIRISPFESESIVRINAIKPDVGIEKKTEKKKKVETNILEPIETEKPLKKAETNILEPLESEAVKETVVPEKSSPAAAVKEDTEKEKEVDIEDEMLMLWEMKSQDICSPSLPETNDKSTRELPEIDEKPFTEDEDKEKSPEQKPDESRSEEEEPIEEQPSIEKPGKDILDEEVPGIERLIFIDAAVTPLQKVKPGPVKKGEETLDFPNILQEIDFLQQLNVDELKFIWERMNLEKAPKNKVIIKQGDAGETFYIIKSGSVKVIARDERDKIFLKKKLRAGNFFGEMSLLIGDPRSATVKAAEDTELMVLEKDHFREILDRFPSIDAKISKKIASRQKYETNVKKDIKSEEKVREDSPSDRKIEEMSQEFLTRIRKLFPRK